MPDLITLTDRAAQTAKSLLAKRGMDDGAIRVSVLSGGCSGLQYHLEPVDQPNSGDSVIEQKGVRVFLDPRSLLYLAGTEMDYKVSLMGSKFVFNNPNAVAECSCGESFTA
jgi:iron-sulfur cluster assembly protein